MKNGYTWLFIAFCLFMTGCGQNASTVSASTAQDLVNHLTYFKDSRAKLCYAVVASRLDFEAHQNGLTITYVPCTPEVEAAIAAR
jgi:hypothetical protein